MHPADPLGLPLTFEQYMSWEAATRRKHEFVRGEVYAMAGVTRRHDAITLNILVLLRHAALAALAVL